MEYVILIIAAIVLVAALSRHLTPQAPLPPTLTKEEKDRLYEEEKATIQARLDKEMNSYRAQILKQKELEKELLSRGMEEIDERLKIYKKEKRKILQLKFEEYIEKLHNDYNVQKELYEEKQYEWNIREKDFQARYDAINIAILREKEILEKENFYKIVITQNELEDIKVLREIEPLLRNKEVLNRLIFDAFMKRPLGEMIKRLEVNGVSGIYKITYLKTGEAYIGKSVDVGKRWTEHVKTSLGIGTIASSSLHTKIKKEGIENFSFELIEKVPRDKLGEREKFYIDLFKTGAQLNMKQGG